MNNSPVIVCASDANYAQHLGIMLCSLFENYRHAEPLTLYIIDGGLQAVDRERLVRLAQRYRAVCHVVSIDDSVLEGLKLSQHVTAAAYLRLFIPAVLPTTAERALYLDSDLIVQRDIMELWSTDVADRALAAVVDQGNVELASLAIPSQYRYFNSGVMLMNLKYWRENDVTSQVLDFIRRHPEKIEWWDQDGLNAILYRAWVELPLCWNVQSILVASGSSVNPHLDPIESWQAVERPAIVHFTTSSKPWQYMNIHPLRHLYFDYLRRTEWRDYKPVDRTPINLLRRIVRILRQRSQQESVFKCLTHLVSGN